VQQTKHISRALLDLANRACTVAKDFSKGVAFFVKKAMEGVGLGASFMGDVGEAKDSWVAADGRETWFNSQKIGNQMQKRGLSREDVDDILINYKRRFKTTI